MSQRPKRRAAAIDSRPAPRLNLAAARFAADWYALWPERSGPVGLAVSGGPDSLALLALAHATIPGTFEVATVDHGLRQASAAEAVMVARLCADRAIPHRTIAVSLGDGAALQARARDARYAALADWLRDRDLGALVTAHQLEDQAETLVMRLNRRAGVKGLAGMRPRSVVPGYPALPLLRPLLAWRRAELRAVVDAAGLVSVEDPSNCNPRFERVRVRNGLAGADWLDPAGLAASALQLADADEVLDWAAEREWDRVSRNGETCEYAPDAPRAVRLLVLMRIVETLAGKPPRGRDCARWLDTMEAGRVATLGGVRGDGGRLPWRFARARPHRPRSD